MDRVLFSLEEIVDILDGGFVGTSLLATVGGVSIDTRTLRDGDLFVALPGENTDGHKFLDAAFRAGAVCALVKRSVWETLPLELQEAGAFILVEDPLAALQQMARRYLDRYPSLLKIAVTGSNGKTSTKEMLAAILSRHKKTYVSSGNYNSEIGLPLAVFGIRDEHVFGVFELGTNRRGEMAGLASILKPNIAIITNIGTAHIGMFGSREAIAEEKSDIFSCFDSSSQGLIWEEEPFRDRLRSGKRGTFHFFGIKETPGVEGLTTKGLDGGVIRYKGRDIAMALPGYHNLLNGCAAISAASMCGADFDAVAEGIASISPSFGRSEFIRGDVSVFQDCYNANVESLKAGLSLLSATAWEGGRKIGILGSMKELGSEEAALHVEAGILCADSGFDAWYFFGEEAQDAYESYLRSCDEPGFWETDAKALEHKLLEYIKPGDLVYLKGSRSVGLERFTEPLTMVSGRCPQC